MKNYIVLKEKNEREEKVTLKKKVKEQLDDKMVLLSLNECGGGYSS